MTNSHHSKYCDWTLPNLLTQNFRLLHITVNKRCSNHPFCIFESKFDTALPQSLIILLRLHNIESEFGSH